MHESIRPEVSEGQRVALEEMLGVFLERGEWPNHAYLDQELHARGIDFDKELETLPERLIAPDSRRSAGTVFYQDDEKIALMIRGLVACADIERYETLLIAFIRWAVERIASLKVDPHERPVREWQAVEAIEAMKAAVGGDLAPYDAKLVFEVVRWESGLPSWSGLPTGPAEAWTIHIPREIRRFEDVKSLDDYLELTKPKEMPPLIEPSAHPFAPVTSPLDLLLVPTGAAVVEETLAAEAKERETSPQQLPATEGPRGDSGGWSALQKIGLVVGIIAGLFGIGFGISKLVNSAHPTTNIADSVSPICGSTHAPFQNGTTALEREWPRNPVNTFRNCHDASGEGKPIAANQLVRVYCRSFDPTIKSSKPGWWYRVASAPWNGNYFATANTFLNGDPQFGPYHHPVDLSLPKC